MTKRQRNMYVRRLKSLRSTIASVPERLIDLSSITEAHNRQTFIRCGSQACIGGWSFSIKAVREYYKKQTWGLRSSNNYWYMLREYYGVMNMKTPSGRRGCGGLDLFASDYREIMPLRAKTEKERALKRIDWFIKHMKSQATVGMLLLTLLLTGCDWTMYAPVKVVSIRHSDPKEATCMNGAQWRTIFERTDTKQRFEWCGLWGKPGEEFVIKTGGL